MEEALEIYKPQVVSNPYLSVVEDFQIASRIQPFRGTKYNPALWPDFTRTIEGKNSELNLGVRRYSVFTQPSGRKIILSGEIAAIYKREENDLFLTFADTRDRDANLNQDTSEKLVELLDQIYEGNSQAEEELFSIKGIALQRSAWKRTVGTLKLGFRTICQNRVEYAATMLAKKSWNSIIEEHVDEITGNFHYRTLESFLKWGEENGINPELLKEHFTNLHERTEKEFWETLGIDEKEVDISLKVRML